MFQKKAYDLFQKTGIARKQEMIPRMRTRNTAKSPDNRGSEPIAPKRKNLVNPYYKRVCVRIKKTSE
jgi:hypothetical protein